MPCPTFHCPLAHIPSCPFSGVDKYIYIKGIFCVVAYSVRPIKMDAVVRSSGQPCSMTEYFYWLVVMQDTQMRNTCLLDTGKQNVAFLEMPVYPIEDFTFLILYSKEINIDDSRHLGCCTELTRLELIDPGYRGSILFLFHWHVQNAMIPYRSQELFPFLPVIYFFLPLFSTNCSSIFPHFILPSISWSR
jgi:hypothetical protein